MGLTVAVGLYAQNIADGEDDLLDEPFELLNLVLAEHGQPPHFEPKVIAHDAYFEAQMWGYGGLHALRRVAAHLVLNGRLPSAVGYSEYTKDAAYIQFSNQHDQYARNPLSPGFFGLFRKPLPAPPFQHLMMHSDAEGFYIPRDFGNVIVDWTQPERPGLGMMIGSSIKLLEECDLLAEHLELPANLEIESDEFLELMESPRSTGKPWQILAIETHGLVNLRQAARVSIETGAAIEFT